MNRYPLWKNLLIGIVMLWGLIYTLPNFYGEVPAVQISSGKATLKLDASATIKRLEESLATAGIQHDGLFADLTGEDHLVEFLDHLATAEIAQAPPLVL